MKRKSNWGGYRPGAGRPKGHKAPETLLREAAAKEFKERVARHADELFNAQYDLAVGEKYLMVRETTGMGKNRKTVTSIVTDAEIIKSFLDGELENTDVEYYYMTTKPANNLALDSLLNRSLGKAEDKLDITTGGDKIAHEPNPELADRFSQFMEGETLDS
jgi:hypothetical protein